MTTPMAVFLFVVAAASLVSAAAAADAASTAQAANLQAESILNALTAEVQ